MCGAACPLLSGNNLIDMMKVSRRADMSPDAWEGNHFQLLLPSFAVKLFIFVLEFVRRWIQTVIFAQS